MFSPETVNQDSLTEFPALLEIEYPDGDRNWVTVFFRMVTVIPIAIVLGLLSGPMVQGDSREGLRVLASGIVFLPTALMLLFRRKYPRWWFDWNLELTRFNARVSAYLLLLRDEYPSTDQEQAVHLAIPYPDATELSRWLPLIKWFLAIPHYIVLTILSIAVFLCTIVGWFAILLTGSYPRPLFDFVIGVFRWWLRVAAYAFLLTTDRYPPFRLSS